MEQMGVEVKVNEGNINLKCRKLRGTDFKFNKPSHTATEVMIMTAVCADGETVIRNAAMEPEIDDLILMLRGMGASIKRDRENPSIIIIKGKKKLTGVNHQVIGDRNEAVTFACAALSTRGSVSILRINPKLIEKFLATVEQMGAKVNRGEDEVLISWYQPLRAVDIETEPEPGFMTDWQAVFSLVLSQATGVSSVVERIFPYRFQHIKTLEQMGVRVKFFNPEVTDFDNFYHFNKESDKPEFFHGVKIYGPAKLKPTNIKVNDLRAGATATLAALTAEGESVIDEVEYIVRGYEKLAERLKSMGAEIKYLKV
jgi:UDP-N-acetylglucosamine 1-carboxyvinyltransferase